MKKSELKVASSVAFIFFCRMMGLFMVLPVLSLYGRSLEGATLSLLGLALGVYGLSQAFLQIPFAMLSDVYGRKRIMLIGLSLFFAGSLLAVFSDNIWLLILSRLLQGSGAIAGTSMALLADTSSEESRARVMAMVGIAIGGSFVIALVLGPVLAAEWGLKGVFIVSSLLAFLAILACFFGLVDTSTSQSLQSRGTLVNHLRKTFSNKKVYPYALSVFVLHLSMTSSFIVIPLILEKVHGIDRSAHWQVYLGVFFVALLMMGPFARPSAHITRLYAIYQVSAAMMSTSLFLLVFLYGRYYVFLVLMCVFFCSFNLMEALLPSMLSLEVDADGRAGAMGVFSTFQFLGAFCGAWTSGIITQYFSMNISFAVSSICVLLVLVLFSVFKIQNLKVKEG